MGKPNPPRPPDPKETASASTSTNVGTSVANAVLNNANQITPDGNLTYDQTGTYDWFDPFTNQTYKIPKFTATQTLSPSQAALKAKTEGAQLNLADLAGSQSSFLKDYMAKPFDGSNEATEARLLELGRKRLDPLLDRRRAAEDTRLANQGIRLGSTAYDRAMEGVNQAENDAYNQLLLQGHGQAFSEGQAIRNQPINEITALLSGSQVSQPNYAGFNQQPIPTTDVAGLINENYNQRMGVYNSKMNSFNDIVGGLFGLGASAIKYSDRRLKTDIKKVGELDDGTKLYKYRYKGDGAMQLGVMAQEVKKTNPAAVVRTPSGYDAVDYAKIVEAV